MTLGQIQLLSAYVAGSGQLHVNDLTAILAAVDAYPTRVTVYSAANQAIQTTYNLKSSGGSWIGLGTVIAGTDQAYPSGSLVSLQCNAADISGGGGGGSGTVNAGTTNQLAVYPGAGSTVGGLTVGTGLSITSGTISATAGGTGTIAAGTIGQIAVYSGTGTAVGGLNTGIEIDSAFGAIGTVTASGGAATVNAATNSKWTVNLSHTASTAITISGAHVGQVVVLRLVQDSTGSNLASFPGTTISWQPGSYTFTQSTDINAIDIFTLICTGTNTYDGVPPWIPGNTGPPIVTLFATTATWTKPAGKSIHRVWVVGGGGGGGSGNTSASGPGSGGAGGGGGGAAFEEFRDGELPGSLTVTVPTAAAGGVAISASSTNGNPGGTGGQVAFGTFCIVKGGTAGGGGTTSAVTGPVASIGMWPGGPGGNGGLGSPSQPNVAQGKGAGGGGGGAGTNGGVASAGGQAGATVGSGGLVNGPAGGAIGTAGTAGLVGNPAASAPQGGTGGSGGGSSVTGNAGAGGAGGAYGGGGGGGGACLNASTSGAGGAGGAGMCLVISY